MESDAVDLPPWSISLVAPSGMLPDTKRAASATGRFPARPFFTFWHPPYARKQPRVSAEGVYSIDLTKLTDKPMAIAKMNIEALQLEPGKRYELGFEGRSEPVGGIVVKLPDSGVADDDRKEAFVQLGADFRPLRFEFTYAPSVNEDTVSLFFPKDRLARGGQVAFRAFSLRSQ